MSRPANEPGIRAVLQALTRILERAAAMRAGGCDPRAAINRAIAAERPSFALARVARAAWALALLPGDPEPTSAAVSAMRGEDERAPQAASAAWGVS